MLSVLGWPNWKPELRWCCIRMPEARARDVHELKARAEQGDVSAQFRLGTAYVKGRGVQQNDAEALKWYRLAAGQGETRGQLVVGTIYA